MEKSPHLPARAISALIWYSALLPLASFAQDDVITKAELDPFVYVPILSRNDPDVGDTISIAMKAPESPISVVAFLEYYDAREKTWRSSPASSFAEKHSYRSRSNFACTWASLTGAQTNTAKVLLFFPYKASELPDGRYDVRYNLQIRSKGKLIAKKLIENPNFVHMRTTRRTERVREQGGNFALPPRPKVIITKHYWLESRKTATNQ